MQRDFSIAWERVFVVKGCYHGGDKKKRKRKKGEHGATADGELMHKGETA